MRKLLAISVLLVCMAGSAHADIWGERFTRDMAIGEYIVNINDYNSYLNARREPKRDKGNETDKLAFGEIVYGYAHEGDWVFICRHQNGGIIKCGWVSKQYLKRIRADVYHE